MSENLDPDSGVPLYRQIAARLMEDIDSGVFKPGDKIPTETELSRHYGVSTATIRSAMGILQLGGVVVRRQGVGTFVARPAQPADVAPDDDPMQC